MPLMTDIWSTGIILYAMLCGYLPFEDSNYRALYSKVLKGKYEVPKWLSEEAKDLLSGIINTDPLRRFNMDQILGHSWLKGVSDNSYIQHERIVK